jgi:IS5 family transposase
MPHSLPWVPNAHARHFRRAGRCLKTLRNQLGRVIRDIDRKVRGNPELVAAVQPELARAKLVHRQQRGERGAKIYALHAPEVECIGKGKAHKPWEFGVKVSVATPIRRQRCGQLVVHAMALPGKPYDGHTLTTVLPEIERLSGIEVRRVVADRGYRGHGCPRPWSLRVFIAGQKRRVTDAIRCQLRRRSAVEPVIGHMKSEHRMGRNHLAGRFGDAADAILAAAGYNFRRLLAWLAFFCALLGHTLRVHRERLAA